MTLYKPNLKVNELLVTCVGKTAFREKFHSGLNIIRGQNSSGKSTIMDFLFYGLGGDILENQWRETAINCDVVMVEVEINGSTLTLAREVDPRSLRPMRIFYGKMIDAEQSVSEGWEVYSFTRSSKESFSQILFRFLGLPEVEYGESNSRLTVNQILRLLYSDQMTSVERIFRPQRFDLAITRTAIGNLLCGAYSDEYYKAQLRKKGALEEFRELTSSISFLTKTHGRDGHPLTLEWLTAQETRLQDQLLKLNENINDIEAKIFDTEFTDRLSLNDQTTARNRVVELQEKISDLEKHLTAETFAAQDAENYISSIEQKLADLQNSQSVVEHMGGLSFQFCPSCLAPLSEHEIEGACSLCKSAYTPELAEQRVLKLINEYSRQRDRATDVQVRRREKIVELRGQLRETTDLWEQASRHYTTSLRNPTSEMRAALRDLNRKAGYAYRELEELAHSKAIITEISEVRKLRESLQEEIEYLDAIIESGRKSQEVRLARSRHLIEEQILDFLKKDLARQSTFSNADRLDFEFDADRLAVNGESYFSASSMVYLRNSFFASFLFAAANDPNFLHPRLLIMDTVEDKGLEPERSKNFQRILFEKSQEATSDHQIIIATSMIDESLDIPSITVGENYTHERRTLRFLGD